MAKLYFKYGAMGSSKSAQALITQFNYEELGMSVWLIKPSIDTRDGADLIRSRIGLEARARIITPEEEPVNLDGELMLSRDLRLKVLPAALRFFAPKNAW